MFAVPTLEAIARAGQRVSLVVTQPDRPKGRGMELAFSPVKQKALELGLPITQPEKIKNNTEFCAQLEQIAPDCIIVVGYGRIIPRWMLDLPRFGNINLHASLLPKYRGAAPIQWAIASGETVTGNTTMLLNEGLDTGDILMQREVAVDPDATSITLAPPLSAMGADLVLETLAGLEDGSVKPKPQNHDEATLAPILTKEDARINFTRTAKQISDRLRGFQPWPGAFTTFRGKQLTFHAVRPSTTRVVSLKPGEVETNDECLLVGCGENSTLEILELQLEGKKRMTAKEFANGYQPKSEDRLGE